MKMQMADAVTKTLVEKVEFLENEVCWLKEEREKMQELLVRANDSIKSISLFGVGFMNSGSSDSE